MAAEISLLAAAGVYRIFQKNPFKPVQKPPQDFLNAALPWPGLTFFQDIAAQSQESSRFRGRAISRSFRSRSLDSVRAF